MTALYAWSVLALAPLTLPAGVRTFPEIAALVGETPTEVKCDPEITHRAVFVRADTISREGLLDALGLTIVPDGKRKLLKDANAKRERDWATDMRLALGRRYARTITAAVAAADNAAGTPPFKGNWAAPFVQVLTDRKATPAARRQADDGYLAAAGEAMVAQGGDEAEATVRALAAFPSEVPVELLERGAVVDVQPLAALPPRALGALRKLYPALKGGAESLVVRRRALGGASGFPMGLTAGIGIVDPGIVVGVNPVFTVSPMPFGPEPFLVPALVWAASEGSVRLPGFAEEVAELQRTEGEGQKLVTKYASETASVRASGARSLSQVAEVWAAKGHNVVMELDPTSETLDWIFDGPRLRAGGEWSPRVVEGVLVLRPLLRFFRARRHYPFAALRALEAGGAEAEYRSKPGGLPSEAIAAYVRLAGPTDRWETTSYRGWDGEMLDLDAAMARTARFVPPNLLAESERRLKTIAAKGGVTNPDLLKGMEVRLSDLPLATQSAIAAEMRLMFTNGINTGAFAPPANILAHSPSAMTLFLREGTLRVELVYEGDEWKRRVLIRSDVPVFNSSERAAGLTGE